MNNLITIIFSYDRCMQLDLCLNTLKQHCNNEDLNINVLYNCSNYSHDEAYKLLIREHPDIKFHKEKNFKQDLIKLVEGYDYIFFVTDDNITTRSFSISEIKDLLKTETKALGFSLRLGVNTKYCYSLNCNQEIPPCVKLKNNILMFGWANGQADFNYPLEVSSSIYLTKNIMHILYGTEYENPNDLEWNMYQCLPMFTATKPLLMCYETSVAFCDTINKVKSTNTNRSSNYSKYSTSSLLTEWENCGRIEYSMFDGFISNAAHQEVDIEIKYGENDE
jgi:hypothetical protein